jgi:hypothetical protein
MELLPYDLFHSSKALAYSSPPREMFTTRGCQCSAFVDSKISFVPLAVAKPKLIALEQCI